MIKTYPLKAGMTSTRKILAEIREAHRQMVSTFGLAGVEADERRDRSRVDNRYVFGIHTGLRDTLTVHYIVGSGELSLVWPSNYIVVVGTDSYTQLRVAIYDDVIRRLCDKQRIEG